MLREPACVFTLLQDCLHKSTTFTKQHCTRLNPSCNGSVTGLVKPQTCQPSGLSFIMTHHDMTHLHNVFGQKTAQHPAAFKQFQSLNCHSVIPKAVVCHSAFPKQSITQHLQSSHLTVIQHFQGSYPTVIQNFQGSYPTVIQYFQGSHLSFSTSKAVIQLSFSTSKAVI